MKTTLLSLCTAACAAAAFAQNPATATDAAATQPEQDPIMQIDDLLSASGAFFLATADGDQPKLRPLGAHHVEASRGGTGDYGVKELLGVQRSA